MALTQIKTASIGDDQVTVDKLANAINTDIAANAAKVTNATHTGDVTGGTALTIAANAVETGMIAADAVDGTKIADDSIDSEHYVDGSIDEAHLSNSARKVPQNTQGSSYTLAIGDVGKHILAGGTVEVPNNVFAAGDAVTIVNNTGGDLTITKTITTMYMSTDATSTNRTLATRGMATILFASGTVAYISGAGLS